MAKEENLNKRIAEWEKELLPYWKKFDELKEKDRNIINSLFPQITFIVGILVGLLLNLLASAVDRWIFTTPVYKYYLILLALGSLSTIIFIVKILPLEYIITSFRLRILGYNIKKDKRTIGWAHDIYKDLKALKGKDQKRKRSALARLIYAYLALKMKSSLRIK